MTLKYEFLEKFSLSLNEFAKHKDVTPEKVWAWIEEKLLLQDMEDAESSMNESVFLQNIEQAKMDGYYEAIDDAIKHIYTTHEYLDAWQQERLTNELKENK